MKYCGCIIHPPLFAKTPAPSKATPIDIVDGTIMENRSRISSQERWICARLGKLRTLQRIKVSFEEMPLGSLQRHQLAYVEFSRTLPPRVALSHTEG